MHLRDGKKSPGFVTPPEIVVQNRGAWKNPGPEVLDRVIDSALDEYKNNMAIIRTMRKKYGFKPFFV